MPRMSNAVYASHINNVLKLAQREGGVSRPQIVSELGVSSPFANKLILVAALSVDRKEGRTQFFKPGDQVPTATDPSPVKVKQSRPELPPEVKEAAVPESDATGDEAADEAADEDALDEEIADIDAEIADTKQALRDAAVALGKAAGLWAMQDAAVEALRLRMTGLITKRMNASS